MVDAPSPFYFVDEIGNRGVPGAKGFYAYNGIDRHAFGCSG